MQTVESVGRPDAEGYAFEITPHCRYAQPNPIQGITVSRAWFSNLDGFGAAAAYGNTFGPFAWSGPRAFLPSDPRSYLEVIGVGPPTPEALGALLLDMQMPTSVALVNLVGHLSLKPDWNSAGRGSNFGLPRHWRIYALKHKFSPPDEWTLCGETDALDALWGWTPLELEPTVARYLLLVMSDLPTWTTPDGVLKSLLLIRLLAIHGPTRRVQTAMPVQFTPVSLFASHYDLPPEFWTHRGIAGASPQSHESIHRDVSTDAQYFTGSSLAPTAEVGMDLLPSALVGFGMMYPDVRIGEWIQLPYASSALFQTPADIALTLRLTEGPQPVSRGIELLEPYPRRTNNSGLPAEIGRISVFATDADRCAFSSDFTNEGWRLVSTGELKSLYGDTGLSYRHIFSAPVQARYLRIVFHFDAKFDAPRRLELAVVRVLRDPHFTVTPPIGRDYLVAGLRMRLTGRQLLDDYGRNNTREHFDVALQRSINGRPWATLWRARSLLDLRDRLDVQIISNTRRSRVSRSEEIVEHEGSDYTNSTFESETETTQTSGWYWGLDSLSVADQNVKYFDDTPVTVVRDFPSQEEIWRVAQDRPWTFSVGLGITSGVSISGTLSSQINGGVTDSYTSGRQHSRETRDGHNQYNRTRTVVSSVGAPNWSRSHSSTRGEIGRSVVRTEREPRPEHGIVRGCEVQFEGMPTDILVCTGRLRERLRSRHDQGSLPDRLRLFVAHLPLGVELAVTFKGVAIAAEVPE